MTRAGAKGFTLIETLATAVMAALLLVAILKIVGVVGRDKLSIGTGVGRERFTSLVALVRSDLSQARVAAIASETILLTGPLLYSADGTATHLPARVEYRVEGVAGKPWLMRVQTSVSSRGATQTDREPLLAGVSNLSLTPLGVTSGRQAPTRYRLVITQAGKSQTAEIVCQ